MSHHLPPDPPDIDRAAKFVEQFEKDDNHPHLRGQHGGRLA